jgi:hypothetical protein
MPRNTRNSASEASIEPELEKAKAIPSFTIPTREEIRAPAEEFEHMEPPA